MSHRAAEKLCVLALLGAGASSCVYSAGASHRSSIGGAMYSGVDVGMAGMELGFATHAVDGTPRMYSVRGDVHVGTALGNLEVDAARLWLLPRAYAGFDRSWSADDSDTTWPVGMGLRLAIPIDTDPGLRVLTITPRWAYHLGTSSEPRRKHEYLLTVGYGFAPEEVMEGLGEALCIGC